VGRRRGLEAAVLKLSCGEKTLEVRIESGAAWLGDRRMELAFCSGEGGTLDVWLDGRRRRTAFVHDAQRLLVWCEGRAFAFERAAARAARAAEHAGGLVAPMPGRVRKTLVHPGERVEKGQVVLILEAMKMEHAIRAPYAGVLSRLARAEGELVEAGAELAVIEG
jgi:3-methylcrotonyl-CoA carboxylase alpha subunit